MSRTAIVSAMQEELRGLHEHLCGARRVMRADREFWLGTLDGREVVLVLSRIGKVAAATTATVLLTEFAVERILFTGVAGGLGEGVSVGDVVVAGDLLQHDMDASPLFPRWQVPLYGTDRFGADPALSDALAAAAATVLAEAALNASACATLRRAHLQAFALAHPRVHRGLVLSGDRFVGSAAESAALRRDHPGALAVEMEGAALAQVCRDFDLPFAVMRTISDRADDDAHTDFGRFIADVAARYTAAVSRALLRQGGW